MLPSVDLMLQGASQGEVAAYMANHGRLDPAALRPFIAENGLSYISVYQGGDVTKKESFKALQVNNGTLRRDEWKQLDDAILPIARTRLAGIADLESAGLVYNLGNAMGTTVLEHHTISDALTAEMTMDGVTRAKNDRVEYGTEYLPIPIIHVDYEINARSLEASRKLGNPLDTTNAEYATRKVAEQLESLLFTDKQYQFGAGKIYSYVNYPHRNPVALKIAWDDSAITPELMVKDVLDLKAASIAAKHYGPWVIYIPTSYERYLDEDYNATSGKTIRTRILEISGIKDIKVSDTLAGDNILLVQMTPDVVRLVKGLPIQNVQWQQEGMFVNKYKVLTIQVPQIRSDHANNCGIVHMA